MVEEAQNVMLHHPTRHIIAFLIILEIVFCITFLLIFRSDIEREVIIFRPVQQETQSAETTMANIRVHASKMKGLDFTDLVAKVKGTFGKELHVDFTKRTQTDQVKMIHVPLPFPKKIDTSNIKPSKKATKPANYVFVYAMNSDQLSKNTRAFLSLCAQAVISGRKVVTPHVKQTKLGSDKSWNSLETYYDLQYLDRLLKASGYATLVDQKQYDDECMPSGTADHVSIHFIDNGEASKKLTQGHFHLDKSTYNSILERTKKTGWTECAFLDQKMKIKRSKKQFCVNADVVRDWKVLERDVIRGEKCCNIYLWRGIDGVNYRLKFKEDHVKFSSIDVQYALRPGTTVVNEVKRFREKFLPSSYIAVYLRSEGLVRHQGGIKYLRACIELIIEVLQALKTTSGLSHVFLATDMSSFGSSSLVRHERENQLNKNFFHDIHETLVSKSQGVVYKPSDDVTDRGVIALVDITLVSQGQHLISAGSGTFQELVAVNFLENHRNEKEKWSKIRVCT